MVPPLECTSQINVSKPRDCWLWDIHQSTLFDKMKCDLTSHAIVHHQQHLVFKWSLNQKKKLPNFIAVYPWDINCLILLHMHQNVVNYFFLMKTTKKHIGPLAYISSKELFEPTIEKLLTSQKLNTINKLLLSSQSLLSQTQMSLNYVLSHTIQ